MKRYLLINRLRPVIKQKTFSFGRLYQENKDFHYRGTGRWFNTASPTKTNISILCFCRKRVGETRGEIKELMYKVDI